MRVSKYPFEMSAKVDHRDARAFLRKAWNVMSSGFKFVTRVTSCAFVRSFRTMSIP